MKDQFELVYPIIDSDRTSITDKKDKLILFDSIEAAKAFREANDWSNINDSHRYWLTYDYLGSKKPNLKDCYIQLYE